MDNLRNRNNTLLKNNSSTNVNMRKVIIYLLNKCNFLQNKTVLLNQISLCDELNEKNPIKKIKNSRSSLSYLKGESEKEHNIRILESQLDKTKLSKLYADKLSLLLYDSPKYKNYPFKRKNIDNIEFKYNKNNELRLTLRKYPKKESPQINPNIQSPDNNSNKYYNSYSNIDFIDNDNDKYNSNQFLTPNRNDLLKEEEKIFEKNSNKRYFLKLNDEVKTILYNSDEEIPISKQKEIYEKFKKKFHHYKKLLKCQLYLPLINSERPNKISKFQKFISITPKSNDYLRKKINMYNKEKILKTANELGNLMDKNDTNKKILYKDNILGQINKLNKELSKCKSLIKIKKKVILPPYEMFNYNSKKWKKEEISKNNKNKNINFDQIDKKIIEKINEMKNKVIVLNQEIFKLEEVRNKMKSQKKLRAIKSKSFRSFESLFSKKIENIKATKKFSKNIFEYE